MKRYLCIAAAGAALVAPLAAAAQDYAGTDFTLAYSNFSTDETSDDLTSFRVLSQSRVNFGGGISTDVVLNFGRISVEDIDVTASTLGLIGSYEVALGTELGLYAIHSHFSGDDIPNLDLTQIGGQITYVGNGFDVTAYAGVMESQIITSGTYSSVGIHVGYAVTPDFGVYGSLQQDTYDDEDFDLSRAAIGGAYSLAAATGAPVTLFAEFGRLESDGTDVDELTVGATYALGRDGAPARKPVFDGTRSVFALVGFGG